MFDLECKKFKHMLEDYDNGILGDEDRASCQAHLDVCVECRRSLELWRTLKIGMRQAPMPKLPPFVERKMIVAALSHNSRPPKNKSFKPVFAAISVASIACLVVALLYFSLGINNFQNQAQLTPKKNTHIFKEGLKQSLKTTSQATVKTRSLLNVAPDIRLWINAGTEIKVKRADTSEGRFFLSRGHVVAEIDKHPKGYRFVVETAKGIVEATGTVFSVEVKDDETAEARVLRGKVRVANLDTLAQQVSSFSLSAGQSGTVGGRGPVIASEDSIRNDLYLLNGISETETTLSRKEPQGKTSAAQLALTPEGRIERVPDIITQEKSQRIKESEKQQSIAVNERIREALSKRKAGNYETAQEIYRRVLADYPHSASALSCYVSLGQLELNDLKKPEVSIIHFNAYLDRSPDGFLAEEARFGLVKAHHELKDTKKLIQACHGYLEHHLTGYAVAQVLRIQAETYIQNNNCQDAHETAAKLEKIAPESVELVRIKSAINSCPK